MTKPALRFLLGLMVSCWTQRAHAQSNAAPSAAAASAPPAATKTEHFEVYDKNTNARIALLATGIPLLVLSYGLPCAGARGVWCAPVVGPLIKIKQIADREAQKDSDQDGIIPPAFIYTLLAGLAAVQLVSVSLIAVGALLPPREVRRVVQSVNLVPSFTPSTVGLTAVGTF